MSKSTEPSRPAVVEATVAFVDVKGFTALAERAGSEAAYFAVTGCIKMLDGVIRQYGGAVDRYLGDALMAVFGHPVPLEDAPGAALDAALDMRRQFEDYKRELGSETPLELVVGINTGPMVAGDIGREVVREFHVLGDAVNVAARIKSKTRLGGIGVGPKTRSAGKDRFEFATLGTAQLKGKTARLELFELLGSRESAWRRDLAGSASEIPWIGRETELTQLRDALGSLRAGRGGVVEVLGEAGVGKTRLIAEAFGAAEGVQVLGLRARHLAAPDHAAQATDATPILAELGPALSDRVSLPTEPGTGVTTARALTALEAAVNASPTLLVLEDAHQLDAASVAALPAIFGLAGRFPLLVVLVGRARPARLEAALAGVGDALAHRQVVVPPLSPAEVGHLIDTLTGAADPEARALIEARGAGNPRRLVLASHLEPALRAEQSRAPARAGDDTERRRATILFADITGFTAMTERLGAERAYPTVAGCLALLDEIARKHGGVVEKYLGDCVMALFGVHKAMEDAPRASVNAAIEMRRRVREYSAALGDDVDLDVHTGINVGLAIAGDVSGDLTREFTVMGDPVSVADELKDLAPAGEVFVGGEVERFTREVFDYAPEEPLQLKGRGEPVASFRLTSDREHLHRAQVGSERRITSLLVGRDTELSFLRERIGDLDSGRGGVVSLVAEAGLGKSRLIAELAATPEARRTHWLLGRSLSTGGRLSFHPFADLLRAWAEIGDEDDDAGARAKLTRAVAAWLPESAADVYPFIAQVLGLRLDGAERARIASVESLDKMVLRYFGDLLRAGSRERPLVVVMDDLHWADLSSVELLGHLLHLCERHPVLFLHLSRPGFGETSGAIQAQAAHELPVLHHELVLHPLDTRAARQLLFHLFGPGGLPQAVRVSIEEKAHGNPFYLEEVVRAMVDEGAAEFRDGRLRATERIDQMVIPGSVQEVIQARVDRLERSRRAILQSAAVIGQSFHREVLGAVAGANGALQEEIQALLDAEFLVPSDRLPGEEYAFKHPLIQEVTYEGLLQGRREELHRGVGEAIERKLDAEVPGYHGMLAYHFSRGRDLERAERFLRVAGDEAAQAAASNEALQFFEDAARLYLELHGDRADARQRAELEAKIASALYYRGRFVDSVEHYDRALELLGDRVVRGGPALQRRLLKDLGRSLLRLRLPAQIQRHRAASAIEREILELRFARAEATTYASPTRHASDALNTLTRVMKLKPESVPRSARVYSGAAALFAFGGISYHASRRLGAVARRLSRDADPADQLYERAMNFTARILEGDWDPRHEIDPKVVDDSVGRGDLWAPVTYLGLLAEKRVQQGQFDEVARCGARIDEVWEQYQYDMAKTNHYWLEAIVPIEQGRFEAGREGAQRYYEENPEDVLHLLALGARARAEIALGDLGAAEETLLEAGELFDRSKPVAPYHASQYAAARLLFDVTRFEGARAGATPQRALRRSLKFALANASRVAMCRPEIYRLAGRSAWLEGRRKRAVRWFETSARAAERLGARVVQVRILAEVGARFGEGANGSTFLGRSPAQCLAEAEALGSKLGFSPQP